MPDTGKFPNAEVLWDEVAAIVGSEYEQQTNVVFRGGGTALVRAPLEEVSAAWREWRELPFTTIEKDKG